jgi:tripartite-type tricarboxylate transporter receptor subunit TctC
MMRSNRQQLSCRAALALLIAAIFSHAWAADYPAKPIRLIVPSAPGGTPDIVSRLVAGELSKNMGQLVVVDNRPGASGIIGYEAIAKATPDGHTFGNATFTFITNPIVLAKLPYDTSKDFQPVVLGASNPSLMTVTPALPVQSVRELIEYARAHPGKLSYGSIGPAGSQTLAVELFKFMTGTQIAPVGYKGMQQAITDTIAGQIQIVCDTPLSILPHIRAGRLRLIGVTSLKRVPTHPDIPTIAESGLPGFETVASAGYVLPARTPRDIVLRLNAEINKAFVSPAIAEKFAASGVMVSGGTPEQFAEHLKRETAKWAGVIKAAGITPQ